jgi:hypothetical protein
MKMKEKMVLIGASLMLFSVVLVGCTALEVNTQNPPRIKIPAFTLGSFIGIWDFHHPNTSLIEFHLSIENPNNEAIDVQLLFLYVIDTQGNLLLSFRPNTLIFNNLQSDTEHHMVHANENLTLYLYQNIQKDAVSAYCWNYLSTPLNTVSISGLYRLNGDLQWFESNLCEIDVPICK